MTEVINLLAFSFMAAVVSYAYYRFIVWDSNRRYMKFEKQFDALYKRSGKSV